MVNYRLQYTIELRSGDVFIESTGNPSFHDLKDLWEKAKKDNEYRMASYRCEITLEGKEVYTETMVFS